MRPQPDLSGTIECLSGTAGRLCDTGQTGAKVCVGTPGLSHTKDDQLASHDASKRAAERIPGARFVSLESGGHLMIGQQKKGRDELAEFFAETRDRGVEQVAS